MKTKILILSLIAFFIFSCKSDDESTPSPTGNKLLTYIDWGWGEYIEFKYNDDRTIQSIDISNDYFLNFQYSNNKIETLLWQWGADGETDVYNYTYDSNGKINSITIEGEMLEVIYDPAEDSYTYHPDEGETVKIFMEGEDIFRVVEDNGVPDAYTYNYGEGLGPLAGTNAVTTHIIMALPDAIVAFIIHVFSKKNIQTYQDGDDIFEFENEFDPGGLIIRRDYHDFNDEPVMDIFNYSQF